MPTPLAPPRPELLALLDAIKDHPDDDTPRLVLADWLDEQDNALDAERAAFIREQIAQASKPKRSMTAPVRRATASLLRRWYGSLGDFAERGFHRGLPHLEVPPDSFLSPEFRRLFGSEEFAFVQLVHLKGIRRSQIHELAALPELRYVSGLRLQLFTALDARTAAALFASPSFTGLRQFVGSSIHTGELGMRALAANPALVRLRKLSFWHCKLVDRTVAALASGIRFPDLEVLDLAHNLIGDGGAKAISESTSFPNLRALDLRENPRLTDRGKQLLRDTFGDRVKIGGYR